MASGKVPRICFMIHALLGYSLDIEVDDSLAAMLFTKWQYSARTVAVSTIKKSIAAITSRKFFRKISQPFLAPPLRSDRARHQDAVLPETSNPSFNGSPRTLGACQVGFSLARSPSEIVLLEIDF